MHVLNPPNPPANEPSVPEGIIRELDALTARLA